MQIEKTKSELKISITKNITNTLNYLLDSLNPDNSQYNNVVLFSKRNKENNQKLNQNIIDFQNYNIEQNRITIGLLELIDNLESNNFINAEKITEKSRKKYTNKLGNVSIKAIKSNEDKQVKWPFLRMVLKYWVYTMLLFTIVNFISYGFTYSPERLYVLAVPCIFFTVVYIVAYLAYYIFIFKRNDSTWSTVGQKVLEIEVEGEHANIMDTLFHSVKNSKFKIDMFDIDRGQILGKRWWWYSRIIEINKNKSENLINISIRYRYPYQAKPDLLPNSILLSKFKSQLIEDFNY